MGNGYTVFLHHKYTSPKEICTYNPKKIIATNWEKHTYKLRKTYVQSE
jgi:hypothetical protein